MASRAAVQARRAPAHAAHPARGQRAPGAAAGAPARRHLEVVPDPRPVRPVRRAPFVEQLRRAPTASVLLWLTGILCALGVIVVTSASSVLSLQQYGSPFTLAVREVMWVALGAICLWGASRTDYRSWRRFRVPLMLGAMLLLVAVLVPGVGQSSGGASRWIGVGVLRLQPSEIMKLALAVFGADLMARRSLRARNVRTLVVPLLLVSGSSALLILAQPDMGTAIVLGFVTLALLFGAGVPLRSMVKMLTALAGLALVVGLLDPYRRARLLSFLQPGAHRSGSGYQVLQSLIGLGSGRLTGLGLGASREKWGLLPNAHTDFAFSVVGEELGFIGAVLVLLLLGMLAWYGLRAAGRAPDRFGALLSMALVAWIVSETVINVGAVVGVLPVTGIPLPFISFGGSSLVITMVAVGILVNVARHERLSRALRPLDADENGWEPGASVATGQLVPFGAAPARRTRPR